MNTTRLSLLTIAAALALAGCGNKGPLVLPDAPDEAEAPVAVDEVDEPDTAVDESAEAAADPAAEPIDDTDAPVEPEPLPQDDGDGG
jgi:predicted small lipoprotein YifL